MKTFVTILSLSNAFSFSTMSTSTIRHQVRLLSHPPHHHRHHIKSNTLPSPFINLRLKNTRSISTATTPLFMGKPKSGSIVDSYQTVSVNCKKCRTRLFRYKKKNGTKSNLIKCYVERISEDCVDLVAQKTAAVDDAGMENGLNPDWICPNCDTRFGKDSIIHGRPAIKLVGGKTAMTKK